MRIAERSLREHLQLLAPLFGVIGAVWGIRLVLAFVPGVPYWLISVFSVSIVVPICIGLSALLIYARGFDSYASVVLASFLLVSWGQLLIVLAILLTVFFGIETIYTAPEFSLPDDPNHFRHIVGHLTIGIGLETIIGSLMGSLILFMLRRTSRRTGSSRKRPPDRRS